MRAILHRRAPPRLSRADSADRARAAYSAAMSIAAPYPPRRPARSRFVDARGLRQHLLEWGDASLTPRRPADARHAARLDGRRARRSSSSSTPWPSDRHVLALDWRGFGASDTPAADTYFFPEYLGDLELVLDAAVRRERARRSTCSATAWAATSRCSTPACGPTSVRRLVNLEGFGMPRSKPAQAPARIAQVARRAEDADAAAPLRRPRRGRRAAARRPTRCCAPTAPPGSPRTGRGRPATATSAPSSPTPNHKRMSPLIAQVDDWLEFWKRITAPLLWIEGDRTDVSVWWGDRYTKAEFHERLNVVADVAAPRRRPGRPHAAPRPPRGHRPAARSVPVRIAPSAKRARARAPPWTSNTSMPSATAWPT